MTCDQSPLILIRHSFELAEQCGRYVRFKDHRDAVRCIEALTPTDPDEVGEEE